MISPLIIGYDYMTIYISYPLITTHEPPSKCYKFRKQVAWEEDLSSTDVIRPGSAHAGLKFGRALGFGVCLNLPKPLKSILGFIIRTYKKVGFGR